MIGDVVFEIISLCCVLAIFISVGKVLLGEMRDYFGRERLQNDPWGDKWHDQWRNN